MLVAVVHGAGSSSDVSRALFASSDLPSEEIFYLDNRTGVLADVVESLEKALGSACDLGTPVIVAGVSMGAHAAAAWSLDRIDRHRPGPAGLVIALPAWLGSPGAVGQASAATADAIRLLGSQRVLAHATTTTPPHMRPVLALLARGWSSYRDGELADCLANAGRCASPAAEQLRRLTCPTAVVGWTDDALHPLSVARSWAEALPSSIMTEVGWQDMSTDPARFGRTGFRALSDLGRAPA